MGKSRAEIQKAYRQRLKDKNNEQYLAKERQRRMAFYIPSSLLGKSERLTRNEKNRDYLRRYRSRKRALARADLNDEPESNTSGYESSLIVMVPRPDGPRPLQIQMAFPAKAKGSCVRLKNALEECKREIKEWKQKYETLQRKYRTSQRFIQRSKHKEPTKQTPRSKTEMQIRGMRLGRDQACRVRKHLLFTNVICEEMSRARSKVRRNQRALMLNMIGGRILKKYKCIKMASNRFE